MPPSYGLVDDGSKPPILAKIPVIYLAIMNAFSASVVAIEKKKGDRLVLVHTCLYL